MLEDFKKDLSSFKLLTTLLTIAVIIYLLQIGWEIFNNASDIITVAVIAWMLSFLLEPVTKRTARILRLPLPWATLIVYLFVALIFGGALYVFVPSIFSQFFSLQKALAIFLLKEPSGIQHIADSFTSSLTNYLYLIPLGAQFFLWFFVILILSFYFIVEKERINDEFYNLLPDRWHENVRFIQSVINQTFASFFRVQFIFGVLAAITTWVVLQLFGINYAASIGIIAGLFTIIPFIGQIIGIAIPVLVALTFDPVKAIFILVILTIASEIIFNVYGPRLMGKAFKLHPLVVFISFFIGVKIYGILGGILAVPVLGIITIVYHELNKHYKPRKAKT